MEKFILALIVAVATIGTTVAITHYVSDSAKVSAEFDIAGFNTGC